MVLAQAKLTSKNQITIPSEARKHLGLKAGDTVYLSIEDGRVVLQGLRGGWTEAYAGLGQEVWRSDGGGRAFIESERDAWDDE